jgi:hypothetical protein
MAAYKTLKGQSIRQVAQDPTNPLLGEIWYNTTIGLLKGYRTIDAAWASGGALPAVRSGSGGAGIQNAALNIGGENGSSIFGTTEEYNGAAWASGGALNATPSFFMASGGTQTAGFRAGGFTGTVGTTAQNAVENYDGSSWTNGTALPVATGSNMFAGTQTAGLAFGGQQPSVPGTVATSLSYNGSSWTSTNALTAPKSSGAGFGTQTAAIAAGGGSPPLSPSFTNNSQIWDGTNWTNTSNLNNNKTNLRGWGSSSSGAVAGGRVPAPSSTSQTEEWNGSSWSASATLGTGGYLGSTAGGPGSPSGLYAGS